MKVIAQIFSFAILVLINDIKTKFANLKFFDVIKSSLTLVTFWKAQLSDYNKFSLNSICE